MLCDATNSPKTAEAIDAEIISSLTRHYLIATPKCGPLIADEIIEWAKGQGIAIPEAWQVKPDIVNTDMQRRLTDSLAALRP